MNRVTISIAALGAVIIGSVSGVALALPWPPGWPYAMVALAFLVPGRVQGVLWREFFRGRRALDGGKAREALAHFSRFEALLTERPRLGLAIFLQWSVYTWNARAMLANNIGACRATEGDLDAAEAELQRALTLDPGYPLPYFNLAVVARARGLAERAEELRVEARSRGFRGGSRDRLIAMAGAVLARYEGRL